MVPCKVLKDTYTELIFNCLIYVLVQWENACHYKVYNSVVVFKCLPVKNIKLYPHTDRLCGLVVRVLGYRSGGPCSIPRHYQKKNNRPGTGSTQPREYN
jgi:hypothetical protein